MGLLTGDAKGEVMTHPEKMVSVFVPTTPNPTSGWLIFVPVECSRIRYGRGRRI